MLLKFELNYIYLCVCIYMYIYGMALAFHLCFCFLEFGWLHFGGCSSNEFYLCLFWSLDRIKA